MTSTNQERFQSLLLDRLFNSSMLGDLKDLRSLIKMGADINQSGEQHGGTPLLIASQEGHLEVVKLLIESGGSVNEADNRGATPLWIASGAGHLEIVKLLIKSGGSVNQAENTNGITPLYIASECGHLEVVKLLIKSGG